MKKQEKPILAEQAKPAAEPYQLYILRPRKFHQAVLDEYAIFYSRTLKHFVTYSRQILWTYPRAVLRTVEFGDFALDPRLPKFKNG